MKKKISILSIFVIAIILFTSNVFATETFTHEGATYVIDEIKLKLDSLGNDIDFWGMDQNNNYIYFDFINEKFYKVTEKECTAMSSQEILDLMNNTYYTYNYVDDNDLNIYQEKSPVAGAQEVAYIITEDKIVDSNKEYLERTQIQEGENISIGYQVAINPDLENGTYYERVTLITPKTAKIDENISYYKYNYVDNTYVKVENPKEEDAYTYAIIGESEQIEPKVIGKMSQEVYDKIFLNEMLSYYIVYDEENNEIYILMTYEDSKKSIIYKADGTKIKEFDSLMEMNMIGNKFFMVAPRDEHWNIDHNNVTILDKKGNNVYKTIDIPFLEEFSYGKHTIYLKNYEYIINEFYNMYEYKLITEDNQKYEGKDLQVKTSGELDRLTSVKVNGVELDASNYTKTSGSTIITLKNDYLKTLELGTYTLELGYIDGTKVETKFIVDKIYSNDNENDVNEENSGETAGDVSDDIKEEDKNKGEKDDTPKTGNTSSENNIAMFVMIISAIVGIVISKVKIKE